MSAREKTREVKITEASEADRETVLFLVERLLKELEDNPEEFQGVDPAKVLRDLDAAPERFTAFLARDGQDAPIGVATVVETFAIYAGGHYGVIDEMYVVPDRRGEGIGERLLEAVKEHGRRRGWLRVDVTAPPEKRWKRTVKFYEAAGFVFTGPKLRHKLR
ncbi:MAG TPA: GNAT family N-acetyltransferase [Candidatus Polarisedimenticolia bacterium]|jgi:GNAT superfamily N-acetyltransferase|nr:GNAT family N-acetyltransferase [Candidatus Polarisedimenticolia bacterium]